LDEYLCKLIEQFLNGTSAHNRLFSAKYLCKHLQIW